jgi:hypothetical protein
MAEMRAGLRFFLFPPPKSKRSPAPIAKHFATLIGRPLSISLTGGVGAA